MHYAYKSGTVTNHDMLVASLNNHWMIDTLVMLFTVVLLMVDTLIMLFTVVSLIVDTLIMLFTIVSLILVRLYAGRFQ